MYIIILFKNGENELFLACSPLIFFAASIFYSASPSRLALAIRLDSSNSARRRAISAALIRSTLEISSFQLGSPLQRSGFCTVVFGTIAVSSTCIAKLSVACWLALSDGRPAGLPNGKSLNRKRGTPTYSTISFAHPSTTVGMPASSNRRADRLTV